MFGLYSNRWCLGQESFKKALNTTFWHTTIPDQVTVYLTFHNPFLEPHKPIHIFYNCIVSLVNQAAFLAFETLFASLFTPKNNIKTTTTPTRFFLSYYRNWKGFQFTSLKPFLVLYLSWFYQLFLTTLSVLKSNKSNLFYKIAEDYLFLFRFCSWLQFCKYRIE